MTQDEIRQVQAVQREFLHDAATTLELDPHDEGVENDNFGLVFDSHRQAIAVARLAVKNYLAEFDEEYLANRTKSPRWCYPAVVLHAGTPLRGAKYLATMDFEKD